MTILPKSKPPRHRPSAVCVLCLQRMDEGLEPFGSDNLIVATTITQYQADTVKPNIVNLPAAIRMNRHPLDNEQLPRGFGKHHKMLLEYVNAIRRKKPNTSKDSPKNYLLESCLKSMK